MAYLEAEALKLERAKEVHELMKDLIAKQEEIERLREALAIFADENRWEVVSGDDFYCANVFGGKSDDPVKIAREALEKK